jgi:hypothetical protein
MPLVRLEVENFKSYRGKQIIGPFFSFSAISASSRRVWRGACVCALC